MSSTASSSPSCHRAFEGALRAVLAAQLDSFGYHTKVEITGPKVEFAGKSLLVLIAYRLARAA
jgi:hypothetical protein